MTGRRDGTAARDCHGKRHHRTRAQADRHVARLVHAGASAEALHPYLCHHCDGWHVGHRPRPRRRR